MKKRYNEEQIITILREAESGAMPVKALYKRQNISEQTFFLWRNKFGGMDVPDARQLKELESENAKLKRLVAEQLLAIEGMKDIVRKNDAPGSTARSSGRVSSSGAIAAQVL